MSGSERSDHQGAAIWLEREGPVATLTLSDPARRNAFGAATYAQMRQACDEVDEDQSIGALVVRGDDGHFCSGADRALLADVGRDPVETENYAVLSSIYAAVARVGQLTVPVVAAVRGAALGAGLNLALAADVRVVAEDCRLMSGFAPIGMHPGGGHFNLLTRATSRETAAALAFFADPISGHDAVRLGLAWECVPDDRVEPRAHELARVVAADPDLARAMKRSLQSTWASTWDVALDAERSAQMWTLSRKHGPARAYQDGEVVHE